MMFNDMITSVRRSSDFLGVISPGTIIGYDNDETIPVDFFIYKTSIPYSSSVEILSDAIMGGLTIKAKTWPDIKMDYVGILNKHFGDRFLPTEFNDRAANALSELGLVRREPRTSFNIITLPTPVTMTRKPRSGDRDITPRPTVAGNDLEALLARPRPAFPGRRKADAAKWLRDHWSDALAAGLTQAKLRKHPDGRQLMKALENEFQGRKGDLNGIIPTASTGVSLDYERAYGVPLPPPGSQERKNILGTIHSVKSIQRKLLS